MVKGKPKKNKHHVIKKENISLLKFAAIYGANGAGKSNLMQAIKLSSRIILGEEDEIENHQQLYCRITKENQSVPSNFEYEIAIDDKIFSYGFSIILSEMKIIKEWLYDITNDNDQTIYELVNTGDDIKINFNFDLIKENENEQNRVKIYISDFKGKSKYSNTSLLLTLLNNNKTKFETDSNLVILNKVYDWFANTLEISFTGQTRGKSFVYFTLGDANLLKFLEAFGTGIKNVHQIPVDLDKLGFVNSGQDKFFKANFDNFQRQVSELEGTDEQGKLGAILRIDSQLFMFEVEENSVVCKKIVFSHFNDDSIHFNLGDESEGTIRLMDLYDILASNNNVNKVYCIDELDRSLHPNLTFKFIKEFLEKEGQSQLIITTHEDRILELDLLRRDEVWFVEKDDLGISKISSLEEFKVRFDVDINKAYLDGRYGSVPKFKNIFKSK